MKNKSFSNAAKNKRIKNGPDHLIKEILLIKPLARKGGVQSHQDSL